MTGTFEFIDNSAIQGKSRKTIRSHVMKGKNAGKARPRHRQLVASQLERSMQIAQIEKTPWGGPKISIHLLSRLCNEMSSFSFPCVITPQAGVLFRECELTIPRALSCSLLTTNCSHALCERVYLSSRVLPGR